MNDRNRNFRPKPIPKPKLFRFGFGSVILTETETADLTILWHFVSQMDFRKTEKLGTFVKYLIFNEQGRLAKSNQQNTY